MRKVFALLVSSCIGLVCGFIVPSGIPEFIDEDTAILADNDATKQDEMQLSTINPGFIATPDAGMIIKENKINIEKVREIDDKALYENSIDKENNLNERSYVYINQKFIPPARKGFHRSKQSRNNTQNKQNIVSPIARKEITNKRPLSTKFSYGFFQPSLNEMIIKDVHNNYILSNNQCEDCQKGKKTHGLKHRKYDKLNTNKGIDDELSYVELLKPPYVRTVNKNNKIKYNYPSVNDFAPALVLNTNNDNKYSNPEISSTGIQKEIMKKNDNFVRLHSTQNHDLSNNEIPHKDDNLIFDDNIMDNSDQAYTPLEETPEERQEMERFQKNTYGEQVTDEKININYADCNYKDCVQTNKKTQRKVTNSKCKCHTKGDSRLDSIDKNIKQKIIGKGKLKTNIKTHLGDRRTSDEHDYDNIVVESASRNLDDELMKTVNKLNYTLQMYR
ncbi:rRNA methyltransferase 2, mitochondrial [Manduca sexta]|uniref:Uncharacterized protein n=1 Tax=Manduca sexta TaxID=7130 RepID=A0A921Z6R7_MANSE|nr:rRNA methyltransferase 2, mitochondrial [Manduca sexta]KAG6452457.1 hypothetical protein O3G_MSEX007646 [Manduca sexta]